MQVGQKKYDKSANEQFARRITEWALLERGLLRFRNPRHHLAGSTETPATYTIKQEVVSHTLHKG